MTTETNPEIESPGLTGEAVNNPPPGPMTVTVAIEPPKRGRGKTSEEVRFGQVLTRVGKWSYEDRRNLVGCLADGVASKSVRDKIASDRRMLAAHVKSAESMMRRDERIADTLATVEGLSPLLREALVRTLTPPTA